MTASNGAGVRAWFDETGWQLEPADLRAALEERGVDTDAIVELLDEGADRRRAQPAAAPDDTRRPPSNGAAAGPRLREPDRAAPGPVPPQNLEAEESVLGAVMLTPNAIAAVRRHLSDDGREFYRDSHARIYRAAVNLYDRGDPVDAITLTDELQERGDLDQVGGRIRLHELAALVPASANVTHYAKIVAGCSTLRDLIRTGSEIARLGWERPGDLDDLIDRARVAVVELEQHAPREPIRISWSRDFISQTTEQVRTLLGDGDDKVLPAHGFTLVYGKGGQGKTTLTLTAVAALASATSWLGIPVPHPVRVLMIENEGPKAPFVEKINRFADQWDGPDWLHNVALYEDPWGRFNLNDRGMRDDLLTFTREQKIDIVIAGPLRGLGIEGPGAPSETDAFLNMLKEAGLGTELAWWIVHHTNKQNQISGDWDRQPDLLLRLTYEGKRRNRLQFEKVRWGNQGREPLVLEWLDQGVGYRVLETVPDEVDWLELEHRVLTAVNAQPRSSQTAIEKTVGGKATQAREAIRRLLENGRLTDEGKGGKKVLVVTENTPETLPVDPEELEWH